MGIEQLLERIACGLEGLVGLQTKMLSVAEQNQARLAGKYPAPEGESAAPAEKTKAEVAEADDRKAREEEYNALKAELTKRGIEIPPRTKLTTLQKLWEQHKDAPVAGNEAPAAEETSDTETAPAAEDVPAPAENVPAPAEDAPVAALMTREEARASITKWYTGAPEDQKILLAAFAEVGATKFVEVKDGDFDRLIAVIDRLRGAANA